MRKIDTILARVEEWLATYVVGFAIVTGMFYVSANVIGRYAFLSPIKGMVWVVALLMIPIAYLSLGYGWRIKGTFVAATFLLDRLGSKTRWIFELFYQLIGLFALAGLIGYSSIIETMWAIDTNHRAGIAGFYIATWPFRATMIIGCFLLAFCIIIGLIKHFRGEEIIEVKNM